MNKKELRALITLAGKVDPSLQAAMLKATNASKKASGGMNKHWRNFWSGMKNAGMGTLKALGKSLIITTTAAAVAFGTMGASGLSYASDLEEVQNVVDTTFGRNAQAIDQFASKALEAYGLTKLEAKEYNATLGAMLKSMGMTGEQTLLMSQNMTALAGDMASFHNLSTDESFAKIRSGISGETEPLKELGINMSVANLQAYAMSQGITKSFADMSQADQAILRYNYLLQATADAQGDFGRTQESFANQQKKLKANFQQTSGEIMSNMMPALAAGMKELNGFIKGLDTKEIGAFAGEIAKMAMSFVPLVMQLMPSFGSLLKLIMPPLLQIGQLVIPIVVQVVQALITALQPILPVVMQLIQAILPAISALLSAIAPWLEHIANIVSTVLVVAVQAFDKVITPIITKISEFWGIVGKAFGGISGGLLKLINPSSEDEMPGYANGGFSDEPAIFGEAGLEAAIPIRRGNPRSLLLLQRTAQMLGVGKQYNIAGDDDKSIRFTYAPVIHADGNSNDQIKQTLQHGYTQMRRMIEDYFNNKDRLAWE